MDLGTRWQLAADIAFVAAVPLPCFCRGSSCSFISWYCQMRVVYSLLCAAVLYSRVPWRLEYPSESNMKIFNEIVLVIHHEKRKLHFKFTANKTIVQTDVT